MNDNLTPKAIVAALDEHIIGQTDAKKAVAVALRNRWRRQKLNPDLREEVTPKNILMIGPTGCGKTEISRRLAKLADAPFVKVEATKFTEVGYVGRDVEQIARDLVEEAVRLERERRREKVRADYREARLLEDDGRADPLDPGRIVAGRMNLERLAGAIAGLPEKTRRIFVLYRIENIDKATIAGSYGLTVRAIEQHIQKAIIALMPIMEDEL